MLRFGDRFTVIGEYTAASNFFALFEVGGIPHTVTKYTTSSFV